MLIRPKLELQQKRGDCILPELQVLTKLRFYAKDMYQEDNGTYILFKLPSKNSGLIKFIIPLGLCQNAEQFVKQQQRITKRYSMNSNQQHQQDKWYSGIFMNTY